MMKASSVHTQRELEGVTYDLLFPLIPRSITEVFLIFGIKVGFVTEADSEGNFLDGHGGGLEEVLSLHELALGDELGEGQPALFLDEVAEVVFVKSHAVSQFL